ncbi:hypothetical protein QBC38DRAFT_465692 [Podospora fimiseda]|uniref:Uncharacterized protein n=1 Tax=Podospora fimiseda TaxID=252190 RepID=A0AAN7BXY1_9PEZI|nr:hypothetical protein QBC38DRAFT_465692 [Podospora fimiseda]
MRLALSKLCSIPDVFWESPESRIQGFFGCDEQYEQNKLQEHRSWFRFMIKQLKKPKCPTGHLDPRDFEWCRVMCFIRWLSSGQNNLLCMPLQRSARKHIWQAIEDSHGPNRLLNPFWMHLPILSLIVLLWDEAIWHLQPLVTRIERSESYIKGSNPVSALYKTPPDADLQELHEILRYALHHAESSQVAVNVLEGMRDHYQHLLSMMDENDSEQMRIY